MEKTAYGGDVNDAPTALDPTALPGAAPPRLTPREIECLRLLAGGESTKRVAHRLAISIKTAQHHVANARKKLGARNSVHAVALAVAQGILGGR